MNEKDIELYKNSLLVFEELRDTTKRISELSDESLKILSNPIAIMTNGLEKVEKNATEIHLNLLTLISCLNCLTKEE